LVKKLEKIFGSLAEGGKDCKTPGSPGFGVIRPKDGEESVSDKQQQIYRSAVGTLLQFIKYSRPDIANAVRELSKCMDRASPAAFKEMKRVIKFILSTKTYGLRVEPITPKENDWDMVVYTDSDWAGDKENLHSVTGFIIFLLGVPVLWKSKLQRTVALSSSEAEYYAISEATKELKFVMQLLHSIGISVSLPVMVNVDNVGAIFMSENASATSRTRHVDARYHFVREYIEDGNIKIIFVKSIDNKADPFTKNVSSEVYDKNIGSYLAKQQEFDSND
jgi:hypothetical protein